MTLAQLLFSQGFGTRRECTALLAAGRVQIEGEAVTDGALDVEPEGLRLVVQGQAWTCRTRAVIVMNKPAGYECSQKPKHHASVYSLLPAPLRRRGVQAVGRLDADTTGVLLFTDDGGLIHRLTSPKHRVSKVYEVACKHAVDAAQIELLREGVLLHDEDALVRARGCAATGPRTLRVVLTEGRYHQVKRMIAAAGNRVESLRRVAFGAVSAEGLAAGDWRWLSSEEQQTFDLRQL